ncbi:MAG TPA: CheR family methyltransferase [Longimicrobium sp.]|nr:CheR family methyltransferase [Longimicrobium sp.]
MTAAAHDPVFEELLEYLRRTRGFDFTGYKRSTLTRRVQKRMAAVGLHAYDAYLDHLERHPEEFEQLFNTILINVTEFYRDPAAWQALAGEHLPALLARKRPGAPVRVWTAGCSTGAETYTVVMMLAELLGEQGFRDRAKVYATDVDEEALAHARAAVYAEKELEGVPEALRARYFEPAPGGRLALRTDLRRCVIFGRHDLVQDAPISHLDLLVCRNTLMYFNAEAQGRILARFHFALNADSLLFLGRAEMMRAHAALFTPVDVKARLLRKVPHSSLRERMLLAQGPRDDAPPGAGPGDARLPWAALDAGHAAQIVLDPGGALAMANRAARALFTLTAADLGRPLQDLRLSHRPLELRSRVEQAAAERRPVGAGTVEFPSAQAQPRSFEVQVTPLLDGGDLLGVSVTFADVTLSRRLQAELEQANQALEKAYEEVQSANEELETTNEELQSTVEELETTNAELQSTNEELETMNEELQSSNEEMVTLNDELRLRSGELGEVNVYMRSILASLRVGVVVVDRGMGVRVWNRRAEDLWGLRADEVLGEPLLAQDIGLPLPALMVPIGACLDGRSAGEEVVVDARNRRGRGIRCRVTCAPLLSADGARAGVILLMEEWADDPGAGVEA